MTAVHVCRPTLLYARRILRCPTCRTRRRCVVSVDRSPWYAPWVTCCRCGEQWSEGEIGPRPFRPRWREQQAAEARQRWRTGAPWAEVRAWVEKP